MASLIETLATNLQGVIVGLFTAISNTVGDLSSDIFA